jgi:hypothetical protein
LGVCVCVCVCVGGCVGVGAHYRNHKILSSVILLFPFNYSALQLDNNRTVASDLRK